MIDRQQEVSRFFRPVPPKPSYATEIVWLSLGGVAFLSAILIVAVGAAQSAGAVTAACCGLPLVAGAVAMGIVGGVKMFGKHSQYQNQVRQATPKPPFEWVRDILLGDLRRIEERALAQLGVERSDLEIEPEIVRKLREAAIEAGAPPGYYEELTDQRTPILLLGPANHPGVAYHPQRDWVLFSRYLITAICPTSWKFGIYTCVLDLVTGRLGVERAQHYPYTHVAAVIAHTVPFYERSPAPTPGPGVPQNGQHGAPLVSVGVELPIASLEYNELQIRVTSGDEARVSLGLIDQSRERHFKSMLMPNADDVKNAVNTALRRHGANH